MSIVMILHRGTRFSHVHPLSKDPTYFISVLFNVKQVQIQIYDVISPRNIVPNGVKASLEGEIHQIHLHGTRPPRLRFLRKMSQN